MLWCDLVQGEGDTQLLVTQGRFEGIKVFRSGGDNTEWQEEASFNIPHTGFCRGYIERSGEAGDTVMVAPSGQSGLLVSKLVLPHIRHIVTLEREGSGSVMSLCPGPASSPGRLMAGYEAGEAVLWDWSNNLALREISLALHLGTLMALTWDWNRGRVVAVGTEARLVVLDSEAMEVTRVREVTNSGLGAAKLRGDGRLLVTGGWDARLRLFSWTNPDKCKPLAVLKFHSESVEALLCCDKMEEGRLAGRNLIVAGGKDGKISFWDIY